ncbi:MAG TPA: hypothetical protein PKE69_04400 [Pyrinomonadaceae bacterium]|nr:hypothetical protein [Pyrinomonadaceae bacterium]
MAEIYLTLLRVGPDLSGNEKGILKVMSGKSMTAVFATRENDVTLTYSSLRMGEYEMEHSMKTHNLNGTPSANPKKCLRPTDARIRSVLIHAAAKDNPDTLQGCLAPGTFGQLYDFSDSEKAMEELFQALDGYEIGKKVTLKVLSNATGAGYDTKETWKRTK